MKRRGNQRARLARAGALVAALCVLAVAMPHAPIIQIVDRLRQPAASEVLEYAQGSPSAQEELPIAGMHDRGREVSSALDSLDSSTPVTLASPAMPAASDAPEAFAMSTAPFEALAGLATGDMRNATSLVDDVFAWAGGFTAYEEGLPQAFEEEVASPQTLGCTRTVHAACVVGLIGSRAPEDALEALDGELLGRGWKRIPGFDSVSGDGCLPASASNESLGQWTDARASSSGLGAQADSASRMRSFYKQGGAYRWIQVVAYACGEGSCVVCVVDGEVE